MRARGALVDLFNESKIDRCEPIIHVILLATTRRPAQVMVA